MAGYREGKRSLARMMPIIILASLVIIGFTHTFAVEATGRILVALVLLLLFMYVTLWVYRVFPSYVEVSERGISQSVTTDDNETWKFEAIRHCEIATAHVDGKTVRALVIETRKGDRSMVGIAETVPIEDLEAILTSKGVKVVTIVEPQRSGFGPQARRT
jgi:Ca2+/Na+ antiporter